MVFYLATLSLISWMKITVSNLNESDEKKGKPHLLGRLVLGEALVNFVALS